MTNPDRTKLDALVDVLATPTAVALPSPEDKPEPEPPVPPRGRPVDDPTQADEDTQAGQTPYVAALQLMPSSNRTIRRARGSVPQKPTRTGLLRDMAFDLLDRHPDMTRVALREMLHCNRGTASNLYAQWRASRRRLALVE